MGNLTMSVGHFFGKKILEAKHKSHTTDKDLRTVNGLKTTALWVLRYRRLQYLIYLKQAQDFDLHWSGYLLL